jgi:O-methyltransferase
MPGDRIKMIKLGINRILRKLTGYQLSKPYNLHLDHKLRNDERSIIQEVSARTMTNTNSLVNLISATKYLDASEIEGAFVECGVWRGGSALAFCLTSLKSGAQLRPIYLFDTFEGFVKTGDQDFQLSDGIQAKKLFDIDKNYVCEASLEDVRNGFEAIDYPKQLVNYMVGDITLTDVRLLPQKIALLRLDTDYYESTKWELENLYPLLQTGGILIVDDYDHWNGSRKACDEYFDKIGTPNFLVHMENGRIMIKQ